MVKEEQQKKQTDAKARAMRHFYIFLFGLWKILLMTLAVATFPVWFPIIIVYAIGEDL